MHQISGLISSDLQTKQQTKKIMGRPNSDFAPLDEARAQEIEFVIDKAARSREAVVIDPEVGVVGAKPATLISPNSNTNGLVRYGRHY